MRRSPTTAHRLVVLAAVVCASIAGCNRAFYRQQADSQANCLIDQKASLIGTAPGELRIEIDPRSRMYSPENPDCPPMPPDDPVAHAFLECVDCKKGGVCNRCAARTPFVENPDWLAFLPRDDRGRLVLDLTAAVDVGLLHSPEFQTELEDLYLSALDVSFERFRFDAQFFGGSSIFYTADGRVRSGTGNSSSLLEVSPSNPTSPLRIEKLTATGGEIVANFANTLVWQFAGPDNYSSFTLLDFTLLQPLLRTGGRTFVLEGLTFSERQLLGNVRLMERFRRGFYLNVATGASTGPGPSPGGFGVVGGTLGFNGAFGGVGVGPAGGYIGLLQDTQELQNARANVAALRASVDQLEAQFDAGRIDRFQVDLARQALLNGQSALLTAEAGLQTSTDAFLVNLGLPPDIAVRLTDPMLEPFQLRRFELTELQADAADLATEIRERILGDGQDGNGQREGEAPAAPEVVPVGPIIADRDIEEPNDLPPAPDSEEIEPGEAEPQPQRLRMLAEEAVAQLEVVEQDYQTLLEAVPTRKENLKQLADRDEVARSQIDVAILSPQRLEARVQQLRSDLDTVAMRIGALSKEITAADADDPSREADILRRQQTEELSTLLLELSLLQARARLDTIDIEPTELSDEDALAIALLYRRDLKNARASLVDAWRLINFNANGLLSDLDLTFSGDIGNVGDNPFRLRDTNGRLRVGLEFDGPLTRLIERNVYRESLIGFQQARRGFYRFVDTVSQDLRATLRQIRLNEINFELSREAVLVAIAQVEVTQLRLSEPPRPGVEQQVSSTTARDLVDALANLLSVQNAFLGVWVSNEVARLNLEFDLGLMQLDQTGQRVPLGMPLKDFADAIPCPTEGGQERLGPDIQPLRPLRPLVEGDQLDYTPNVERVAHEAPLGSGHPSVENAGFAEPVRNPLIIRLPDVQDDRRNGERGARVGGRTPAGL